MISGTLGIRFLEEKAETSIPNDAMSNDNVLLEIMSIRIGILSQ